MSEPNMQPDPAASLLKLVLLSLAKKREHHAIQEYTNPKLIYLVHQQQTLQCHQLLLSFSESHGLKGWVKRFPKSTECTKKGNKKIRSATSNFTSETELMFPYDLRWGRAQSC